MKTNFLHLWVQFCREEKARELSTEKLKELWDQFDADAEAGEPGYFWPDDSPHIEEVHLVLNERGEGKYCAV